MPLVTPSTPPSEREPWGTVVALGITQITSWGSIFYLFPLLMEPLQQDLASSRSAVVGAFSVALMLAGLLAPAVGRLIDRSGGRRLMAFGSLLAAAALAALSQVSTLTQLYLAWIALGVAMACTLYEPAFAVIARAFSRYPRRAIAVLTLFGGFASTVFWPLGQALIDAFGWRQTALIFSALNLALCMPLHLGLLPRTTGPRNLTAAGGKARSLSDAVRDPGFYWLAAAFTANTLVFSAASVHMLAMLAAKGLSAAQAAGFGALIGPMQVAGRFAEMTLGHRTTPTRVGMAAMALLPASLVLLALSGASSWSLVAFALLFGAGNGVMTIVRGTIPLELYGREHYGSVSGALAAPVLAAKAGGPLVAALALELTHDYTTVGLWLAAAALSALVFFTLALRRQPVAAL